MYAEMPMYVLNHKICEHIFKESDCTYIYVYTYVSVCLIHYSVSKHERDLHFQIGKTAAVAREQEQPFRERNNKLVVIGINTLPSMVGMTKEKMCIMSLRTLKCLIKPYHRMLFAISHLSDAINQLIISFGVTFREIFVKKFDNGKRSLH